MIIKQDHQIISVDDMLLIGLIVVMVVVEDSVIIGFKVIMADSVHLNISEVQEDKIMEHLSIKVVEVVPRWL